MEEFTTLLSVLASFLFGLAKVIEAIKKRN
jgi:hypothetical protein